VVDDVATLQVDISTGGTQWGTGGMATKLTAARIACAAGCHMAICHSDKPCLIPKIMAGEKLGTVFKPLSAKVRDRKRWILSGVILSTPSAAVSGF
jgi:glutamate 5-kinase